MLEEKDYNKIGEIVEEKVEKTFDDRTNKLEERIVLQVGEVIEDNILPVLDNLDKKIDTLPDKAYLDDKLADLEGVTVVRQRKEDQKVNLLIKFFD